MSSDKALLVITTNLRVNVRDLRAVLSVVSQYCVVYGSIMIIKQLLSNIIAPPGQQWPDYSNTKIIDKITQINKLVNHDETPFYSKLTPPPSMPMLEHNLWYPQLSHLFVASLEQRLEPSYSKLFKCTEDQLGCRIFLKRVWSVSCLVTAYHDPIFVVCGKCKNGLYSDVYNTGNSAKVIFNNWSYNRHTPTTGWYSWMWTLNVKCLLPTGTLCSGDGPLGQQYSVSIW